MASDAIVNELWEITNKNSDEKIEREEFEEELRTSIFDKLKEMSPDNSINNINDEYARALPVILHQAEVNPDSLGQIQGGKFTISSEIISKAVETVKYENRFIPNTYEYNQRISNENNHIDMKDVVLTVAVVDLMLNNYENLSIVKRLVYKYINESFYLYRLIAVNIGDLTGFFSLIFFVPLCKIWIIWCKSRRTHINNSENFFRILFRPNKWSKVSSSKT